MSDGLLPVTLETFVTSARTRNRGVTLHPATVVSIVAFPSRITVRVDGSDADSVVSALASAPIEVGKRVMVLFYPPQGAIIIGSISGPTMWQKQAWTPVFSGGWVQGNGTFDVAEYYDLGSSWFLRAVFSVGSTTTIGTALRLNLPTAPSANFTIGEDRVNRSCFGDVSDVSAGQSWRGFWRPVNGNTFIEFRTNIAPSATQIGIGAQVTSTAPFTWAATDIWTIEGFIIKK